MAEAGQPRVNPSDWASRRKHAMNRARELRSRVKDAECDQGSDVASLASKSEIQRQRRSRQLEATQRLLDGHADGLNSNETRIPRPGNRHKVASDGETRIPRPGNRHKDERQVEQSHTYNHDEMPVGKQGSSSSSETHSIISQKHLGDIHKRYHKEKGDSSLASFDVRPLHNSAEEGSYARSVKESKEIGFGTSRSDLNEALPEGPIRHTVREKPLEGRGRGRGRGRSTPGSGGTLSLGELSRSSKSVSGSHASAIVKDQMVDARSRSPSITRIDSCTSHRSQASRVNTNNGTKAEAIRSYLRSRRVPDYKEGECEKLALLRQRLVARRRTRQLGHQDGKENVAEAALSTTGNSPNNRRVGVKNSPKEAAQSLERLDPNDYTAKDFQRQPKNRNHGCSSHDSTASPPRTQTRGSHDRHFHDNEYVAPSVDKSKVSQPRHSRPGGDDIDDEASVVDIELIKCDFCQRSFAPKVYEKHFDEDGKPKCATNQEKKRPAFNSAMARIANNSNLNKDEQMQVIQVNKKVAKELSRKLNGKSSKKKSKKGNKWREESNDFREAMKTNRLIAKAEREGKPAHYYL